MKRLLLRIFAAVLMLGGRETQYCIEKLLGSKGGKASHLLVKTSTRLHTFQLHY